MGRPAPSTYDCTWQVINNFALLDIELERVSFYFDTFGYLLEIVWNMDRGTGMH